MCWLISSIVAPDKWKTLTLPCFLDNCFSSIPFTIESPTIAQVPDGQRELFFVSFGCFLSTFLSWRLWDCFWFSLFSLFPNNGDLQPVLWRYSLCFCSLMIFSWSSLFIFEGSWLMILISLNLASESLDLTVLRTEWESKVLHVSPKYHNSPSILSLLFFWVLLLRSLLIILFLEQISVLRNSISFSSVAIILLSTRVLYSSLLCRSNICFISFSVNSLTSFFISRSRISLIFCI